MTRTAWLCIIGLILLGVSALLGYVAGMHHNDAKLAAANVSSALWQSSADANQAALATVNAKLAKQQNDLAAAQQVAAAEVGKRQTAEKTLQDLQQKRENQITKAAHENPDCADLALPLCPAVARQLFGQAGGDQAGSR